MSKYQAIYDMADQMFDSGSIYFWTMLGDAVWCCKPIRPASNLNQ